MKYRCPSCGASPEHDEEADALVCPSCAKEYHDRGGFYDFLSDDAPTNQSVVSLFDAVSRIYETPMWYPLAMRAATGGSSSAEDIVADVAERVTAEEPDEFVDVACGTGLFARAISRDTNVYGVDASEEMLRCAVHNARREGVIVELARADAGSLPYSHSSFDAVACCGALHLLPDPQDALDEMGRILRPDGTLVVTTLVDEPPFGASPLRESMRLIYGMRVFETKALEKMFTDAGFEVAEKEREASLVTLTARRR